MLSRGADCPKCSATGRVIAIVATGQTVECGLCDGLKKISPRDAETWRRVRGRNEDDEQE